MLVKGATGCQVMMLIGHAASYSISMKYECGLVYCVSFILQFWVDLCDSFTQIIQGYITGVSECMWSDPNEYAVKSTG